VTCGDLEKSRSRGEEKCLQSPPSSAKARGNRPDRSKFHANVGNACWRLYHRVGEWGGGDYQIKRKGVSTSLGRYRRKKDTSSNGKNGGGVQKRKEVKTKGLKEGGGKEIPGKKKKKLLLGDSGTCGAERLREKPLGTLQNSGLFDESGLRKERDDYN